MSIRSAAKAIIVDNDKVLLNKCSDKKNGEYYTLPGGGQNQYETLYEALTRECLEETGYTVKPVRFAGLCEEICTNESFREKYPQYAHKMLHIFVCELASTEKVMPTEIDSSQEDCEWIDVDKLDSIRILPDSLGENITKMVNTEAVIFLGSDFIEYNHG